VEPAFLDSLAADPSQSLPVKLGAKTFNLSLKDIVYERSPPRWPIPARSPPRISSAKSRVSAWVIPTNEELMIARHTGRLLGLAAVPSAQE
jgi:hypothetical protein